MAPPAPETAEGFLLLFRRPEAREHIRPYRESAQPGKKCLIVLKRKNRRGHKNRRLFPRFNRLERGAHRDLCLTEADVSAKQSVHRAGLFHVLLDFLYRLKLTVGFDVLERLLEIPLHIVVGSKGKSGASLTFGIQLYKLLCHFLRRRFDLALCLSPLGTAETGELKCAVLTFCADVF